VSASTLTIQGRGAINKEGQAGGAHDGPGDNGGGLDHEFGQVNMHDVTNLMIRTPEGNAHQQL
jgi:hypothetical protein